MCIMRGMNFEITVKIAMMSFELIDRDLFVFVFCVTPPIDN